MNAGAGGRCASDFEERDGLTVRRGDRAPLNTSSRRERSHYVATDWHLNDAAVNVAPIRSCVRVVDRGSSIGRRASHLDHECAWRRRQRRCSAGVGMLQSV